MKYPLASSSWNEREIEAVHRVLASHNFTMGAKTSLFEKKMAEFLGAKFCIMVNSGSSANLLAVASLFYTKKIFLRRGDEVVVPAVSWATTYTPLYQYGLKLRFVDIDMDTLNIDVDRLCDAITPKTKAVFTVNLLGNPSNFDELKSICQKHNLILLEDNCESLGATFQGRQAGTFGHIGTFSTFFSHHISTMEGGVLATDDEEIYHILLSLRSHGWTRGLPPGNLVTGQKNPDPFEESFKFVLPGFNVRPTEFSAAIGIEQLKKFPGIVEVRRKNARILYEKMAEYRDIFHFQRETGKSSFFGFPFILKEGTREDRASLAAHLSQKGIEVRPIVAGNFTAHPVIKYFDYSIHNDLKNSQKVHDLGLFIGNHHYNLAREIDFFIETLGEWSRL